MMRFPYCKGVKQKKGFVVIKLTQASKNNHTVTSSLEYTIFRHTLSLYV